MYGLAHRFGHGRDQGWLAEHYADPGVTNPRVANTTWPRPSPAPAHAPSYASGGLEGHHHRRRHRGSSRTPTAAWKHQPRGGGISGVAPGNQFAHQPELHALARARRGLHQRGADRRRRRGGRHGEGYLLVPGALIDWQGSRPDAATPADAKAAHPNSRFTVAATNNLRSTRNGTMLRVRPSTRLSGGRRSTVPLVTEARSWMEGVYMAATMARRPRRRRLARRAWCAAIRSRCQGSALPHERHHFSIIAYGTASRRWLHLPRIFCVNWFRRTHRAASSGRVGVATTCVLKWIIDRIEGRARARDYLYSGIAPALRGINWAGWTSSAQAFDTVMHRAGCRGEEELRFTMRTSLLAWHLPELRG